MVEQRFQAVLQVLSGASVTEVARRFGVSRQAVHRWLGRYRDQGLAGLSDRSSRPRSSPARTPAAVEALICELRRNHPRWGARRLVWELMRRGCPGPVPSKATVHRVLVRHGLVQVTHRGRRREDYTRWQRSEPMQLWQLDIVGGIMPADGTECKIVTGVDDHSRYCVAATVVARPTGRAVCLALAEALSRYGIPDELLTDNGKQFTARFGRSGEVLFDRICRENGITHPHSPTTTGKVERFHQTLRRELLDEHGPFASIEHAQQVLDAFVADYNTHRPHQALDMNRPTNRFQPRHEDALPLRLPPALRTPCDPRPGAAPEPQPEPLMMPPTQAETADLVAADEADPVELAVEFTRVVPASDTWPSAGSGAVLHLSDGHTLLRTLSNPLTSTEMARLRDARPAGPEPRPAAEPVHVQRRVSSRGQLSVAGRRIRVGIGHAATTVTVEDTDGTFRITTHAGQVIAEVARTTTKPIARFKARKPQHQRKVTSGG